MQSTATVGAVTGKFFRDFRAFARDVEGSSRDLRTNLERPALSASEGGNSAQTLVDNILQQVDDLTNEVDQLVGCQGFNSYTSHLSLEALYKRCLAVYDKNEELKEELETKLEQYSYQRKDPTKQKTQLQQPTKLPPPSKIPIKSTSQQNVPKSNLPMPTKIPNPSTSTSNTPSNTSANTTSLTSHAPPTAKPAPAIFTTNATSSHQHTTSIYQPAITQPSEPKQPEIKKISPPSTPPPQPKSLFDDFPRTPTLDDFGISASALEVIAKDEKKQKKASMSRAASNMQDPLLNFTTEVPTNSSTVNPTTTNTTTATKAKEEDEVKTEKRESSESASSRSSMEDGGNFIGERRRSKTKRQKDKSKATGTLFPLIDEIQQEEYNAISAGYLKAAYTLEQLNKAVQKINEHMTDKRFSMDEDGGNMESFTEADLRDDLEFGVKAKTLAMLLLHLKRVAMDKRQSETRFTILEKADK